MGVLTHLDFFREGKKMTKTRNKIKKRFVQEVGDNCRLFYFSNIINNVYPKREIHNLARFVTL